MSPSTFQFSVSTVKLVDRSFLSCQIICSTFSLGGSDLDADLTAGESTSSCVDLMKTVGT